MTLIKFSSGNKPPVKGIIDVPMKLKDLIKVGQEREIDRETKRQRETERERERQRQRETEFTSL